MTEPKSHTERLAELEAANPMMAAVYEQTWRPALQREARLQREAEEAAIATEQANVVSLLIRRGGRLGQLAQLRAKGAHLQADLLEQSFPLELAREREQLAAESEPPSAA